jgi:hypothetical protein
MWKQVRGVWVNTDGLLWSRKVKRAIVVTARCGGYPVVRIAKKNVKLHLLVAEAFLEVPPSDGCTVDHIDRNKMNACASNLRWATHSTQALNRVRSRELSMFGLPVVFSNGSEERQFASIHEGCRAFGLSAGNACAVLKGRRKTTGGWSIRYAQPSLVLPDDVLWSVSDGIEVSNYGHVKNSLGVPFLPCGAAEDGYCRTRGHRVHVLVLRAFVGEKPSEDHTVDHINRIRHDNRVCNLRWATRVEQVENSGKRNPNTANIARRVRLVKMGTSTEFSSVSDAAKKLGIDHRSICIALKKQRVEDDGVWEYV